MQTLSSSKLQSWLPWFTRGLLILGAFLLFARLFELQIIKGSYYRDMSDENRIRRVEISAPRGKVYARGGELLIGNKGIKKRIVFDPESGYAKTDDITNTPDDELVNDYIRYYPLGAQFAHVSGYVGLVSEDEINKVDADCKEKGIRTSEMFVGRTGLEQSYNCFLSGVSGEELIEVDTTGKKIRTLGKREPIPGEDITTNINYGLQKKLTEVMDGKTGSIVVTGPDGKVFALYSSPSYDPNVFVGRINDEKVKDVLNDTNLPLFNRTIGGLFHPGSVYKPMVALMALEEGVIDNDYTFNDEGIIEIKTPYGDFSYKNWYYTQYGGKEGEIGLVKAIARSTDTFFYKAGELIGIDNMVKWSNAFGLGATTGIDLPGEIPGLVPSPEWKMRVKGEKWFLGNTYHMSIGQGDIALTPLQINRAIAVIASDGKLCEPSVVGETNCVDIGIKNENIETVRQGMKLACTTGGTGYTFFKSEPQVACKTGTAETFEEGVTHAWFTFFAPVEENVEPEIVVTVMVEKGGEGSKVAGPIATEIFNYWYGISDKKELDESTDPPVNE